MLQHRRHKQSEGAVEPPLVSVLFITYKRVDLLRRSLQSFLLNTNYPNLELVVTDDGSHAQMQREIEVLPFNRMALSAKNRGLGANTNSGLRKCTGKYVLQLQDDWECRGPAAYLNDAVHVMECHPDMGILKFYGREHPTGERYRVQGPHAESYWIPTSSDDDARIPDVYSDCPHLKRRMLVDFLGYYTESCRMEECEQDYDRRLASQVRFRAAFSPRYYNSVFVHLGENSSFRTGSRLRRLEQALAPAARRLREASPNLCSAAKSAYTRGVTLLYRLRVLRS